MTLGLTTRQTDLLDGAKRFCDEVVDPSSVYALLHRERDRLFPDEMFEDLFTPRPALDPALDRGNGEGAPAPRRLLGERSGRPGGVRSQMEICGVRSTYPPTERLGPPKNRGAPVAAPLVGLLRLSLVR